MKSLITTTAVALLCISSVYADKHQSCDYQVTLNNTTLLKLLDEDQEAYDWVSVFTQQYMGASQCNEKDSSRTMKECWEEAYKNLNNPFAKKYCPQITPTRVSYSISNDDIIAYDSTGSAKYSSSDKPKETKTFNQFEVKYSCSSASSENVQDALNNIFGAISFAETEMTQCDSETDISEVSYNLKNYVLKITKTCVDGGITTFDFTDEKCSSSD